MSDRLNQRALRFIAECNDPKKLRQIANNARAKDEVEIERAALRRLYAVAPAEERGTLEHEVWQGIYALEDALGLERGKTVQLSRTRQKIGRDGEHKIVLDLITGKASSGFDMMIERDMPELTFEAVALRYPARFDHESLAAAQRRLSDAGVSAAALELKA